MTVRRETVSPVASSASSTEGALDRRGVRMTDIAASAGVSAMTVSRVLRDPGSVTPQTLQRVKAAIAKTGYVTNRLARNLATRRTDVIGLIVPSLRNSLFAETIKGVSDTLGAHHPLMIADSSYDLEGEEVAIRAFLEQRICGIVLHNTKHTAASRAMLREAGIPCVETGNMVRRPIDMCVGFSNREAARAMTTYLVERGYQRIAFVSLPIGDNDRAAERRAGHLAALEQAGIALDPALVAEAPPGLRSGGEALVRLLESRPNVQAVFLSGDVLATGALLEANRRGWDVPRRIAIVGSDDNELQESILPPLTTLRFPRYDIGTHAGRLLLNRIHDRAKGPARLDLGFSIVERSSC